MPLPSPITPPIQFQHQHFEIALAEVSSDIILQRSQSKQLPCSKALGRENSKPTLLFSSEIWLAFSQLFPSPLALISCLSRTQNIASMLWVQSGSSCWQYSPSKKFVFSSSTLMPCSSEPAHMVMKLRCIACSSEEKCIHESYLQSWMQ